ncbi:inorganic phosphate transporter [Arthrobacter roseus]|uniref:inorganic phosphate transporter n=1 Tax=Arthrobacter roseus TaxID=136274 RepID=UPI0030845604|nr:PiT family inorganic phosphate transporter [Arthrobacter roseus]
MELFFLVMTVVLAGAFAFVNGFHDVSNSAATAVRTRALTPTIAVLLVAVFNVAGALMGTGIVVLFTDEWVSLPSGTVGLGILLAGLVSAIVWGILTWLWRMPSSSTHALLGGLIGSGLAAAYLGGHDIADANSAIWQIILPLLLSPVVAFVLSYVMVYPAMWLMRYSSPRQANTGSRMAQAVLTGAFALGHGLQDGQRTMAVILLGLVAAGYATGSSMPLWVQVFAAVLLAGGSLFGGWRISHTLAEKLVRVDPLRGMTAQGVSSAMLFFGAVALHMPLSSTHTVASAIVGAGANQRFATIRLTMVRRILLTWLATAGATAVMGAVFFLAISPLL